MVEVTDPMYAPNVVLFGNVLPLKKLNSVLTPVPPMVSEKSKLSELLLGTVSPIQYRVSGESGTVGLTGTSTRVTPVTELSLTAPIWVHGLAGCGPLGLLAHTSTFIPGPDKVTAADLRLTTAARTPVGLKPSFTSERLVAELLVVKEKPNGPNSAILSEPEGESPVESYRVTV